MKLPIALCTLGAIIMVAAITYAFVYGGLFVEARTLLDYPWFHVSMIDLYMGFLLFAGWIIYRERSLPVAIVWIVLLCTLGNLASCVYVVIAAMRARGDWRVFWMGTHAGDATGLPRPR